MRAAGNLSASLASRHGLPRAATLAFALLLAIGTQSSAQLRTDAAVLFDEDLGASAQAGTAIASGDFDGDAVVDIAIGVPGADEVIIHYGGISSQGATKKLYNPGGSGDDFGWSLAVRDFNEDGVDDLVVGAPEADRSPARGGSVSGAGAVYIYEGGPGISDPLLRNILDDRNALAVLESNDRFGWAVETGRFHLGALTAPGRLAIGVPGQDVDGESSAGAVRVLHVDDSFNVFPVGSLDGSTGGSASGDAEFGYALAAGQNQYVGHWLAVGAPFQEVGSDDDAGMVTFFGVGLPWTYTEAQLHVDTSGTLLSTGFGISVASGDLDGDDRDELIIGSPFAARSALDLTKVGVAHILYRVPFGASQVVTQSTAGESPELFEGFGFQVASGNFNGDRYDELVVSSPEENEGSGAIDVIWGSRFGLGNQGSVRITESTLGGTTTDNTFGWVLKVEDVNGDGSDDLAVGVPFKDDGAVQSEGLTYVVPAVSRLVSVVELLSPGEQVTLDGRGSLEVSSIGSVSIDENDRVGALVGLTNGEDAVLLRGEADWEVPFYSEDFPSSLFNLDGLAIDTQDNFAFQTSFSSRGDGSDSMIVNQDGVVAVGTSPLPGGGGNMGYVTRPKLSSGRTYFSSGAALMPILRDSAGGGLEPAIDPSTWMSGMPMTFMRDFAMSQLGDTIGTHGGVDGFGLSFGVNGEIVAFESQEVPVRSEQGGQERLGSVPTWDSFSDIAVWSEGWAVGGIVEDFGFAYGYILSGPAPGRSRGAAEGFSSMTAQDSVGATDLRDWKPYGLAMNSAGQTLSFWGELQLGGNNNFAALSCGPGITGHRPVVRRGDALDLDGDGVKDAKVLSIRADRAIRPPASGGAIVVIEADFELFTKTIVARFPGSACPLFSDGFESGNVGAWIP